MTAPTALSPSLFTIFAGLIEERVGLHYRPGDSQLLADRLEARAQEVGFDSLLDYYYFLRYDAGGDAELDELVDALVINETYFFREIDQLRFVVDELIGPLMKREQPARVWSAACSTGEEPLTLAMLLAERGWLDRVQLVASDVSRRALAQARSGSFSLRSARRGVAPSLAARYLREEDGRAKVAPQILEAVRWQRLNLLHQVAPGSFDVILCRNVIIYFTDELTQRVVRRLLDALNPGGALLVGVSESLMRLGLPAVCRERRGVFFYEKAERR